MMIIVNDIGVLVFCYGFNILSGYLGCRMENYLIRNVMNSE